MRSHTHQPHCIQGRAWNREMRGASSAVQRRVRIDGVPLGTSIPHHTAYSLAGRAGLILTGALPTDVRWTLGCNPSLSLTWPRMGPMQVGTQPTSTARQGLGPRCQTQAQPSIAPPKQVGSCFGFGATRTPAGKACPPALCASFSGSICFNLCKA